MPTQPPPFVDSDPEDIAEPFDLDPETELEPVDDGDEPWPDDLVDDEDVITQRFLVKPARD